MQGAPHILIVDDHREIRDLVARALTKEGFRISAAADGRAMRKVLADGRIDLILPKPFGSRELVARIKAVLRRSQEKVAAPTPGHRPKRYYFDRWGLDAGARELIRDDGVTVPLSTGEYDLLMALVERPQRVLSRDQLLDLARGRSAVGLDRSVDTQISHLRKKLELDPGDPKIIKTVWGGGYTFTPAVSYE